VRDVQDWGHVFVITVYSVPVAVVVGLVVVADVVVGSPPSVLG